MYSFKHFSLELLREKSENTLEISGKIQGIYFFKNVATLMLDYFLKYPYKLIPMCFVQLVEMFLKLSSKTAEEHLIIGITLVHSVISIVFKSLAFLKLEF